MRRLQRLRSRRGDVEAAPPIDSERRDELALFQRHAGIKFKSPELLNLAFCHRSFANEKGEGVGNNERLEFLGDSVLGLAVAEYLYQELPDRPEGDLAKIKSFVVSEASLSEIARGLRIDNFILIGKGEEYSGGRAKKAILADAFEAIIGAFFLDSGFRESRRFVLRFLVPEIDKVLENRHEKDYKTLLQEYAQKVYRSYPKYVLSKKTGPDHDRVFWMDVEIGGKSYGPGKGSNKKTAEQAAAAIAYEKLQSDPPRKDDGEQSKSRRSSQRRNSSRKARS
ncbi:MAG: ribonuclease III [Spirochaetota bacterium]